MVLARVCALGMELLTGIGVTTIGSLLVSWARAHCYSHGEQWILGIGIVILVSGIVGLFFLWKNFTCCYIAHIVVNVLLFLVFLSILVMFWTVVGASHSQAEHLSQKLISDQPRWDGVVECFKSRDLCYHAPHFHDCCQSPTGCGFPNANISLDCARWCEKNNSRCYLCETCKRAIFFQLRAYGQRVDPALISFFILLALVIIIQIHIECRSGGGQSLTFFLQLYHQWTRAGHFPRTAAPTQQQEGVPATT